VANISNYNTQNISLGPGVAYIGLAGTTPLTDVGAIHDDGMELTVTREFLDVFQGSPKVLIKRFVTGEKVELAIKGIEWNLINLALALGTGVTTSSAAQDTYAFGEDPNATEMAVQVLHSMPSGNTITLRLWRTQPVGEWKTALKQGELHSFPLSFVALSSTLKWDNSVLVVGKRLFEIVRQKQ
jgi:hypothetical protein